MQVLIRADASLEIGSGHVMRCLTLANALTQRSAEVTFACAEAPGDMCDYISETRGFPVFRLPAAQGVASTVGKLAQGLEREPPRPLPAEVGEGELLVVDHYALDADWEKAHRSRFKKIMVIDDLANRLHNCDVLLDQNYYTDLESRYDGLVPAVCKLLLGPKYALLREQFQEQRAKLRPRDGTVGRILVFFGGMDSANFTSVALRALKRLGQPNLNIDVVIGAANPHEEEVNRLCGTLPNATLHRQVENMAELMAAADLALGASGTTTWERMALGLPALVVSAAENQRQLAEDVASTGAQMHLGGESEVGEDELLGALNSWLDIPEALCTMSRRAAALVDGFGANHVAEILAKHITS